MLEKKSRYAAAQGQSVQHTGMLASIAGVIANGRK